MSPLISGFFYCPDGVFYRLQDTFDITMSVTLSDERVTREGRLAEQTTTRNATCFEARNHLGRNLWGWRGENVHSIDDQYMKQVYDCFCPM